MKRNRAFWIVLFILVVSLLATLGTFWNVVLLQDHIRMSELSALMPQLRDRFETWPWTKLVLGTLGFILVIGMLAIFFVRLLREMTVTQMQTEFLSKVTHELKTPIATIELTAGLLKETELTPAEREKLWNGFQSELRRLKGDVELLLQAARLEMAPKNAQIEAIHLESWFLEHWERWQILAGSGAQLERAGTGLEFSALVDPKLLELVMINLIENARKHAQDTPKITIETKVDDRDWTLEVRDQGWGFDPSQNKKIFQRFYRAPSLGSQKVAGTGLGLYLVAQACKAMKLKISASSGGKAQGASFVIRGTRV